MEQQQVPSVYPTARSRQSRLADPRFQAVSPVAPVLQRDPRVEDYLDRVIAPLVERVPYLERQRIRAEMAEHLDALVAAHAELETGEDPVLAALDRFGKPKEVTRSWRTSWAAPRSAVEQSDALPGTFKDSLVLAAKLFGAAAVPLWAAVLSSVFNVHISEDWSVVLGVGLVVLAPAAAGMLVGFHARKRPTLTCLTVLVGMIMLGHTLAALASEPLLSSFLNDRGMAASQLSREISTVPMIQSYFWLGIGTAGSALAAWSRPRIAAFRERLRARVA